MPSYYAPRASWRTSLFAALALLLFAPTLAAQSVRSAFTATQATTPGSLERSLIEIVQDQSFEAGAPNPVWMTNTPSYLGGSPVFGTPRNPNADFARTGVWYALLGTGGPTVSDVYQDVEVTTAGEGTLSFWLLAGVNDGSLSELRVFIDGDELDVIDEAAAAAFEGEYAQATYTYDFPAPGTYRLRFEQTQPTQGAAFINWFIDDVSLDDAALPEPDAIVYMPDTVRAEAMTGMTTTESVTLMNNSDEAVDFSVLGFDDSGARTALAWETLARAPKLAPRRGAEALDRKGAQEAYAGDAVRFGAGGPDAFGYTWIDSNEPGGPDYDFDDISDSGTQGTFTATGSFDPNDEGYFDVPFGFSYYGQAYESVRVFTNGFITVNAFAGNSFTNQNVPNAAVPNGVIAPFWDDLDGTEQGAVYTEVLDDGRLVVQWTDFPKFNSTAGNTFQAILSPAGEILFQYAEMNGATNSATVGIENQDGTAGLAAAFNQAYVENGLAVSFSNVPQFVSDVTPSSGTIPAGGSVTLDIDFEAQDVGGTYEAVLLVETTANDLAIPLVYEVTGSPVLELSAMDLDLGEITQGFPSTATLTLFNTGDDVLTVTEISSSDDAFSTDFDGPVQIAAGDSAQVTVTFDPDMPGDFAGTLTVVSDGGTVAVNVTGTAASGGDIAVTPDTLRATAESGETTTATFTIANEGMGDLIFTFPDFEEDPGRAAQMKARYEAQFGRGFGEADARKDAVDTRTGGLSSYLRAGGPDAFGYSFVDSNEPNGPSYSFVDIAGTGTALGLSDDAVATVDLPFDFPFYGESYGQAVVSSNGFVSFDTDAGSDLSNDPIPTDGGTNNLLAVFWDDLNPAATASDDVYVQDMGDGRFIVQWNEVVRFGQTAPLTFQVILGASGSVLYQYETIDLAGSTATVGIENADGTDGLEVSFNETDYVEDGLAIRFSAGAPFVTDVDPASGTLAPGESVEVTATFDATGLFAGVYEGSISIESNDSDETVYTLPVEFTVTGTPDISTDAVADSLDFGMIVAGEDTSRTLTIFNDGTDALVYTPAIQKGIGQNNAFSFVTDEIGPIAPMDSATVEILFSPDEAGEYSATLVLQSNDPDEGTVTVALTGSAINAAMPSVSDDDVEITLLRGTTESTEITVSNDAAEGADALSFTVSVVQTGDPAQPEEPATWLVQPLAPHTGAANGPATRERGEAVAGGQPQAVRQGDLVADGSFEAGSPNPSWEEGSSNFGTPLCTAAACAGTNPDFQPNSGMWWAWFGGIGSADETGFVEQTVTLPSGGAELSYFLRIPELDATGTGTLDVLMDGDVLASYDASDFDEFGQYTLVTLDASAYADGGEHTLRFESTTLAGPVVNFFLDDVSIISTGPAILTVTPMMGTAEPGESVTLTLTADATDVPVGVYEFDVIINTNVPGAAPIVVDVTVDVQFNTASEELAAPVEFTLRPTFPNPVGATGTVRYGLPTPSAVEVRLYDVTGRLVSTLVNAEKNAGWHDAPIEASRLAPGVYVVSIRAGSFSATQKLTVVR